MSVTISLAQDRLQTFYAILNLLMDLREAEEDKIWIRMVDKLCVALDVDAGTYFTPGPKGQHLIARYSIGVPLDKLRSVPIEVGQGLCGWVAMHKEPLLVADAYKDQRFLQAVDVATGFRTRAVLCVPLMDRLDLTGVLEFLNPRSGAFAPEDMTFVWMACRQASLILRMLRQEAMLHKVTSHNASILENLTGGFLAVDMRSRVMICNPAARRILDVPAEIINTPVGDALPHLPALAEILTQTLSTRQTVRRRELAWRHAGQARTLGYSTLLIQDPRGNISGAGITFQDITAVKS